MVFSVEIAGAAVTLQFTITTAAWIFVLDIGL
jgi:hypothetical protein